jgi:hypothetical protein
VVPTTTPYGQDQHDEALAFEHQAAEQATAGPRRQVDAALAAVTAAYILAAGSTANPLPDLAGPGLRMKLVRALSRIGWSVRPALHRLAFAGHALGVRQGERITGPADVAPSLSRQLLDAIEQVDHKTAADLRAAVLAAQHLPLNSYPRIVAAASKAGQAVNRVEATTRWVTNRAVNEGTATVAEAHGVARMIINEPGACLTCLAYAGEIAEPGEDFPAGLTFGDYSTVKEPFDSPPLHPNCRCKCVPWVGASPEFGISLPNALRREAERQVALGRSDYASERARLRAADRLLQTPTGLPEIVKIRGRNAVRTGGFGRTVAKRTGP